MRKLFVIFFVSVLSGAWMLSQALCTASAPSSMYQPFSTFVGTIAFVPSPCQEGEVCLPCITAALVTNEQVYYLSDLSEEWEQRLDSMMANSADGKSSDWSLTATVEGTPYMQGSYNYIKVCSIRMFSQQEMMLQGKWQVYKETITNGDGFDGVFTHEEQDLFYNCNYEFSYTQVYREIYTAPVSHEIYGDYNRKDTFAYSLQPQADGTFLLTVPGLFDMAKPDDPSEGGNSPITIHLLNYGAMEWEYKNYGGDEGPVIYYQYLRRPEIMSADPIPSLCDTWNIHGVAVPDGIDQHSMFSQQLTTDTLIAGTRYVRLEQNGSYLGALREVEDAQIYIVPAGTTHEYLLYAFHANKGDTFDNVWFGGRPCDFPNGVNLTVRDIAEQNGQKVFVLDVWYHPQYTDDVPYWQDTWIEGVGLPQGPAGDKCPFDCAGDYGQSVLCAYKNGVQVYSSAEAEEYGCWYTEQPADTVRLYKRSGDGPGSSTVEPVDPNQITAVLQGNKLIIREYTGKEISYELLRTPADSPVRRQLPANTEFVEQDSFSGLVTISLIEYGTYSLEMTTPEWDYDIIGTFDYLSTGFPYTLQQHAATKVIHNGHLLIRHSNGIFTLTGVQVDK